MTTRHSEIRVRTAVREETHDITERVREIVRSSGIRDGLCLITSTHTTAGIFVNENADPDVQRDLLGQIARLVPDDGSFRHAEGNSPAHIKAVLVGSDVTVSIRDGELRLGRWQGVYFAEFDGPRARVASVTICGDAPV